MVESNLTWDDAIKSLSIFDGSICLREKLKSESSQMIQQSKEVTQGNPFQTDAVKRVFHGKPKQRNQFCKLCKKKGYSVSECWHNNRSGSKNSNQIHLKLTFLLYAIDVARQATLHLTAELEKERNQMKAMDMIISLMVKGPKIIVQMT